MGMDHRYGSCPLAYGSWVWIMGYGSPCGPGVWIGTLQFELQPYILNFLTWRFLTLLNCLRTRVIVLTAGFVQVRLHPCPQNSEKGPSLILQE